MEIGLGPDPIFWSLDSWHVAQTHGLVGLEVVMGPLDL